jgi:hypothetical protein
VIVHVGQSREGIGQADDDHALVQQGRVERGDRRLLTAMLSGGTDEHAANLPNQRALHPEAAGLVEEVAHLGAHIAEARGRAEDDSVVVRELFRHRGLLRARSERGPVARVTSSKTKSRFATIGLNRSAREASISKKVELIH